MAQDVIKVSALNYSPAGISSLHARYLELGSAIIYQAVKDYRKIARKCVKYPNNKGYDNTRKAQRNFFLSNWFDTLCDSKINGQRVLDALDEQVKNEYVNLGIRRTKICRMRKNAEKKKA